MDACQLEVYNSTLNLLQMFTDLQPNLKISHKLHTRIIKWAEACIVEMLTVVSRWSMFNSGSLTVVGQLQALQFRRDGSVTLSEYNIEIFTTEIYIMHAYE